MMKLKKFAIFGVLGATLLLSACTSTATPEPTPTKTAEASSSTLDGGVVSADGLTIREVDVKELGEGFAPTSALTLRGFDSAVLESGGSGGEDCQSNFTSIKLDGNKINLAHEIGDGAAEVCTMDYQVKYFLIESDKDLPDETTFNIYAGDELVITYDMNGDFTSPTP